MSTPPAASWRREALSIGTLGRCIASKEYSDVHELGDSCVLKLFHPHVPLADIEREADISALLHRRGVPVPAIEPRIARTSNGRHGLVLEKIDGTPLSILFSTSPARLVELTRMMSGIHKRLHGTAAVDGLPAQRAAIRERLARLGRISLRGRQQLLALLDELPDARQLCHGNLGPSNIMISGSGRPVILSWTNASNGNPACDAARTAIVLGFANRSRGGIRGWPASAYLTLRKNIYVNSYFKTQPIDRAQCRRWLAINAALRLDDSISNPQRARLAKIVARELARN